MSNFRASSDTFSHLGEPEPLRNRGRVVRMAMFYSLLTGVSGALVGIAIYKLAGGDGGFIFMLSIFGFFGAIFAYWALHYLRDLSASPVTVEAEVLKKWHKGNVFIFFMPSFYILVDGKIFTISRKEYAMLLETDLVRIACYPHSLTIERIERFDETDKKFVPAASGATF